MREEKKRKKLQKALKKLNKKPRIVRPVQELEVSPEVLKEATTTRLRERVSISEDESERRALLEKEWNRYCGIRHKEEIQQFDRVIQSRKDALEELRSSDFDLYAKAIELDMASLPFVATGPTSTPEAVPTAEVPHPWLVDGHYENTTKTYEIQYGDPKEFLQRMLNEENNARRAKKMAAKRAKLEEEGLLRD